MATLVPYRVVDNFGTELFDRFFGEMGLGARAERGGWAPEFDVSETDENIVVKADLPGIDAKDLDISVKDHVLTITGEKKEEQEETREHYHRVERRFGSFCRSFTLPAEVEADKVEASYKDGVLRLTVPKGEKAKPRKITVKAN